MWNEVFQMIIRIVTYHTLPDKNVERWMQTIASELRGVKGIRHVEFIQSQSDPSQYGSIIHFRTREDLDNYKLKETGSYQTLIRSLRETWLDESKPTGEQIFEVLDI